MGGKRGEENSLGCKYFLKIKRNSTTMKIINIFLLHHSSSQGLWAFSKLMTQMKSTRFFCLFLAEAFHQTFIFVFVVVVHLFYTVVHRWTVIPYKSIEGTYLQLLNEEDLLKKWSLLYNLKDKKLFSVSNFSQQWQNTSISHTQNYRTGRIWFSLCVCKSGTIPGQQCCSGLSVI